MPRISGPATEVTPPYAKGRCLGRTIYVMYELKLYMNALDTWCRQRIPYTLDVCSITRQLSGQYGFQFNWRSTLANMHRVSSHMPIQDYTPNIGHIPTHFYPPKITMAFVNTKYHAICVGFGYVMPVLLQNRLPERQTPLRVTAGHHANRVRQNCHAERVSFCQLDSLRYSRNFGYWVSR